MWCWRRLFRVSWTARRSNQSILKEISPWRRKRNGLKCMDQFSVLLFCFREGRERGERVAPYPVCWQHEIPVGRWPESLQTLKATVYEVSFHLNFSWALGRAIASCYSKTA